MAANLVAEEYQSTKTAIGQATPPTYEYALQFGGIYTLLLGLQGLFYGAAALGWWRAAQGRSAGPLLVPLYFTMMNVAVFQGAVRFWRDAQPAAWDKAQRATAS